MNPNDKSSSTSSYPGPVLTNCAQWRGLEGPFINIWLNNVPFVGESVNSAPHAKFADGSLDLIIMKDYPRWTLLNILTKLQTTKLQTTNHKPFLFAVFYHPISFIILSFLIQYQSSSTVFIIHIILSFAVIYHLQIFYHPQLFIILSDLSSAVFYHSQNFIIQSFIIHIFLSCSDLSSVVIYHPVIHYL